MSKKERSLIILCTIIISIILILNITFNFLHSYDNYKYKEELRDISYGIEDNDNYKRDIKSCLRGCNLFYDSVMDLNESTPFVVDVWQKCKKRCTE